VVPGAPPLPSPFLDAVSPVKQCGGPFTEPCLPGMIQDMYGQRLDLSGCARLERRRNDGTLGKKTAKRLGEDLFLKGIRELKDPFVNELGGRRRHIFQMLFRSD